MAFLVSSMALWLLSTAFCFPQCLSTFHNAFLLSGTPFCFPQWRSNFPQWLSNFPQRLSTLQEIQENLSTAASIQKNCFSSFVFPATRSPSFVVCVVPCTPLTKSTVFATFLPSSTPGFTMMVGPATVLTTSRSSTARYYISNHPCGCWSDGIHKT